ncbi:MAG: tetratricopeptide repeat protein [Planctomycetes bacterium]|nr:tetratricopeptide repeat protein [Planctomycetota bacterium]
MQRYPLDSRYPDAKYYLANCLEHSGQTQEAIKEYQEFASWYPQHPNAETAGKKAVNLRYMFR